MREIDVKTVIRAENLGKKYKLGVISRRMLVDQIESYVARKLGKTDPHSKVHEKHTDRMPTPYDFWALRGVSFQVCRGDVVGILGRNGSGKSTLLKILSRITSPTEGQAFLEGRVTSLLEVGTGFHPELTGKENVYLNGSILGLKKREIDEKFDQIVKFAEIPAFMETPVKRYSSGMRVRLAFSVAAHLDPDILILDEVLAVGDAAFQEKCLEKIEATRKRGVTILFVSHAAASVRKLCTKGIVLCEGKLVYQGAANDAVDFYIDSLHLHDNASKNSAFTHVRRGECLGALTAFLASALSHGKVLVDVPIQTQDGIVRAPVVWVSNKRFESIHGRQAFLGAPDICVHLDDGSRDKKQLARDLWLLFKAGSMENWICRPNGDLAVRTFNQASKRLVQSMPGNLFHDRPSP